MDELAGLTSARPIVMPFPRPRSYEDDVHREKRVDRSVLRIIAAYVDDHARQLFVLDPKRPPERLGNRRSRRS